MTPPGRIGSLSGDAGQTQRYGVGQSHVAVIAADKHRRVSGAGSMSSLVGISAGFHLVSSQSPPGIHSPFRCRLGALCDPASEFLRAGDVIELNAVQRHSAVDKMDMRIVEARQQQLARCIDDTRVTPRQASTRHSTQPPRCVHLTQQPLEQSDDFYPRSRPFALRMMRSAAGLDCAPRVCKHRETGSDKCQYRKKGLCE